MECLKPCRTFAPGDFLDALDHVLSGGVDDCSGPVAEHVHKQVVSCMSTAGQQTMSTADPAEGQCITRPHAAAAAIAATEPAAANRPILDPQLTASHSAQKVLFPEPYSKSSTHPRSRSSWICSWRRTMEIVRMPRHVASWIRMRPST